MFACEGSMLLTAGPTTISNRWDMAKEVAKKVIDLLHFADAVTVMIMGDSHFNTTSEAVLREATDKNKEMFKEMLDEVKPGGSKMTIKGLESAFLTLRRAQSEQIKTTRCQQVILWITDGQLCTDPSSNRCVDPDEAARADARDEHGHHHEHDASDEEHVSHDSHGHHHHASGDSEHAYLFQFLSFLQAEQATLRQTSVHGRASIFVATVSDGADSKLPRQVACSNNGTWMPVHHAEDIIQQLAPLQSFFAAQKKESDILWSRFYEDFSGLGLMTTATRPVFSLGDTGPRRGRLLGVVGYDIPLRQLIDNGLRYEEIVGQLTKNIGQCDVYPIDDCQLQILRDEDGECSTIFPEAQCYQSALTGRVYYATHSHSRHYTFEEAKENCRELGGTVAEVRTSDEQSMLSSIASVDGSWIALIKSNMSNEWEWESGIERGIDSGRGFWAKRTVTNFERRYCAAIDSRGTRWNVDVRDCHDKLHLLCELPPAAKAEACAGDIHIMDLNEDNEHPSLNYCLKDYDPSIHINSEDFFELRRQENTNPVFCPMALDSPQPSNEALCCSSCLSLNETSVEEEDSETVSADASSASRTKQITSVLFFSLFIPYLIF